MLVKVITLRFDLSLGEFNDTVVQEFLKDQQVIQIRDYFFTRHELSYLTLVIYYLPLHLGSHVKHARLRHEDWRKLAEGDLGLFNLLRQWRLKCSQKEGVPPYVVLTNQQLVQIVKTRPQTLADLLKIEGVGQGKVEKYGKEILKITQIPGSTVSQEGSQDKPPNQPKDAHGGAHGGAHVQ